MLRAILNRSWKQFPIKQQLYSYKPPITKTIKVRWTRYAGHCWRSKDELISDIHLWTPSHVPANAGRPARTYTQQLCPDTGYSLEDLPETMDDRDEWREREKERERERERERESKGDPSWQRDMMMMILRNHMSSSNLVCRFHFRCLYPLQPF